MPKTALERLVTSEKEARDFGFEWPDIDAALEQAISEVQEIREATENGTRDHIQEEMGDLLHSAVSICRFAGFDIEETLEKTADKFEKRINALRQIMSQRGIEDLHNQTMQLKLELWKEAKRLAGM